MGIHGSLWVYRGIHSGVYMGMHGYSGIFIRGIQRYTCRGIFL